MKTQFSFFRAAVLATVAGLGILAANSASASSEVIKHSFAGVPTDGGIPTQGVIKVGNALYGVSYRGGAHDLGAVYRLPLGNGAPTLLYSFQGGATDGAYPRGNLVNVGGILYGTTDAGASGSTCVQVYYSCGTVFAVTTTGVEHVVYSFKGGTDGAMPYSTLVNVGGMLYGTTAFGGNSTCSGVGGTGYGCGTIFSVDPTTSTEQVVYRFQGGTDGTNPYSSLTKYGNYLYGTTGFGGGGCTTVQASCGTVFRMNLNTNIEIPLHAFSFADGAIPNSGVIKVGNQLWGTTTHGGTYNDGAVFSIPATGGAETFHYDFTGGADGSLPYGTLINVAGTLYGTASDGNPPACGTLYGTGCGSIFKVIPSGIQTLVTFQGTTDGGNPFSGIVKAGNALYGTTYNGGSATACTGYGCGTVYQFFP